MVQLSSAPGVKLLLEAKQGASPQGCEVRFPLAAVLLPFKQTKPSFCEKAICEHLEPFRPPHPTRVLSGFWLTWVIFCLVAWWTTHRSLLNKPILKELLSLGGPTRSKEVRAKWGSMFQEPWVWGISGAQDGRAGGWRGGQLVLVMKRWKSPKSSHYAVITRAHFYCKRTNLTRVWRTVSGLWTFFWSLKIIQSESPRKAKGFKTEDI